MLAFTRELRLFASDIIFKCDFCWKGTDMQKKSASKEKPFFKSKKKDRFPDYSKELQSFNNSINSN